MELQDLKRTAWACVLAVMFYTGVVNGDVESTLARCCVLGANWAREAEGCAKFPTPVAGEASEHQSICLTAAAICCLRFYREQQCEAGKAAAQRGQDCRLPAVEGGEYYKDCCEGCKLGLVSGSMALRCSFRSLQFGMPWDAAYTACCTQLHPDLPAVPPAGAGAAGTGGTVSGGLVRDNTVLYPGSRVIADSENLCLLFPGQLCAHVCVPAPGSYTCQCRAGFTLSVDGKTCLQEQQADRCAEYDACEHICRDTGVSIECGCRQGYQLQRDQRSCADVDECSLGLHSCMPGEQVCFNQEGTYACVNPDGSLISPWVPPLTPPEGLGGAGSTLGGVTDEGEVEGRTSDAGATNTYYLGSNSGRCPPGYKYNAVSQVCDDVDECVTVQGLCGRDGLCTNTIGSYTCTRMPHDTCPPGYRFDMALQSCLDIDECVRLTDNCDRSTQFCLNTLGGFVCEPKKDSTGSCPAGYKYNASNSACEDVDECAEGLSVCREDEVCRNAVGAYDCDQQCDEGFLFSAGLQSCVDIDECRAGHTCTPSTQVCVNEPGGFRCDDLRDTTRLDEGSPEHDVGEGTGEGLIPDLYGTSVPPLVRECLLGFGYDFSSGQCLDIDECQGEVHNCSAAAGERCINTLGSFRCRRRRRCPPGYNRGAGGECVDVDECSEGGRAVCLPGQVCINTDGSFECQVECRDGFTYDPSHPMTCADIDECLGPSPCPPSHACVNNEGSFVCRALSQVEGTTSDSQNSLHSQDRSPQLEPGRSEYHRPEDRGSQSSGSSQGKLVHENEISSRASTLPSAGRLFPEDQPTTSSPSDSTPQSCPPGYAWASGTGRCEDEDECQTGRAHCLEGEVCLNHPGGYRCRVSPHRPHPRQCPAGHRFNHKINACEDINECEERLDSCSASTQTCINSVGGYRCIDRTPTCAFGYRYDPSSRDCLDEDECLASPCAPEQRCRNVLGSYRCECGDGFKTDPATGSCRDVNECQLGSYNCDDSQRCDNTVGSYTCVRIAGCGTGYTLNHNTGLCEDIDECADPSSSPCRRNEHCINLQGSHTCQPRLSCGRGYHMNEDGTSCVDIDECVTNVHECRGGQSCINRPGAYACQCPPGYRLNHLRQCQDVDECTSFYEATCSNNADCENTPGSFLCHCHQGFRKAEGGRSCVDIDECSSEPGVCHHRCINIRGGYQCLCNAGYSIARDNRTCVDIDECEETKGRGRWRLCVGVCENTPGSFQCACPPGYTLASDLRTCKDTNECASDDACQGPHEQCINTRGGFRCMEIACPPEYIRDTSHKSRCKKKSLYCRRGDLECAEQPLSYSYNFLPLVSNMTLPSTGQVDLFTMRGPLWSTSTVHFALDLESVRAPTSIEQARREFFRLRRTSGNQAVISLIHTLVGPQEVQLALSMKLYHENVYSGSAVAKLLLIISEYDF